MYTSPRGIARTRLLLLIAAAALLALSLAEQFRGDGFGWWSFGLGLVLLAPIIIQRTQRRVPAGRSEGRTP